MINRFSIITLGIIIILLFTYSTRIPEETRPVLEYSSKNAMISPTSLLMYESIEKYSDLYEIPKYVAYNVAYKETSYRGPFDWTYKHTQTSSTGALGPMQILSSTANWIQGEKIDKEELKTNIELNIELSMKYLSMLYKRYPNWAVVCGYYNTGYPKINNYGAYCVNNIDYKNKWVEIKITGV